MRSASAQAELHSAYRGLIEDRFALRLTDHQARDLDQKVMQLLALTHFAEPLEMCGAFASGWRTDLLQSLVAELTIGETHFFRVQPQIDALRRIVIPELIARHATERVLRFWSAGCSTGEEPYTLAILLREQLAALDNWLVQIVATDVSSAALQAAQRAYYGDWSFRDTPADVRQRYFTREGKQWRLKDAVRKMVQFSFHNLADESVPLGGLDLILCRNVTIYFSPDATQRIYHRFARSLQPGGWLILGPSDPGPEMVDVFEPVFLPGAVLWRSRVAVHQLHAEPEVPLPKTVRREPEPEPTLEEVRRLAHGADHRRAKQAAERLAVLEPLLAEGHLLLGMLHLDSGATEQALASLRRAAFLNPADPLAHFTLGRAWLVSGNAARARAALLDARRQLVMLDDDQALPGGSGMWAGELRHAVDAQLEQLGAERAA